MERIPAAREAVCVTCPLMGATCALWRLPDDERRKILSDPRVSCPVGAWTAEKTVEVGGHDV